MNETKIKPQEVSAINENGAPKIDAYTLSVVDDIQDTYEYGKLYLVGSDNNFWLTAFHCPCGCGELLELLLLEDANPHWTVDFLDDKHVDLSPSIWKTQGCKSHFFVKNNRVIWVPTHNDNIIEFEEMKTCEDHTKAVIDIVFCIDCTNAGTVAVCMEQQIIRFME